MSTGVGTGFTFTDDKNPFEVSDEMCGFRLLQQKRQRHGTRLQPWKWQLTDIGYSTAAPIARANGVWTRSYAARRTICPSQPR